MCRHHSQYPLLVGLQGFKHSNAYIAAQGPMPNTISDFWRMIWELRLITVVMLTKCIEAGKVCHSAIRIFSLMHSLFHPPPSLSIA